MSMKWQIECDNCGHRWKQWIADAEDIDSAEVTCRMCGSDLLSGVMLMSPEFDRG